MDYNEERAHASACRIENIRAQMDALRTQLAHEKEQLRHDIVKTLRCQTVLGSGPADLVYTSGLLARLKSLEDGRECWGAQLASSQSTTTASASSCYPDGVFQVGGGHDGRGEAGEKERFAVAAAESHRLVSETPRHMSCSSCLRHNYSCTIETPGSDSVQESPSSAQICVSYPGQPIGYQATVCNRVSPQTPRKSDDCLAKRHDGGCKSRPSTSAWAGDMPNRSANYGYESQEQNDYDQYSTADVAAAFQQHLPPHGCRNPATDQPFYTQWQVHPNACNKPSCSCSSSFRTPSYCDTVHRADSEASGAVPPQPPQPPQPPPRHYPIYHGGWTESSVPALTMLPQDPLHGHVHEEASLAPCACHALPRLSSHSCRHTPQSHYYSPEQSPRGKHMHAKTTSKSSERLRYNKNQMHGRIVDDTTSGFDKNSTSLSEDVAREDDFAESQIRRGTPDYIMESSGALNEPLENKRQVQVSPRSKSPGSARSEKIAGTMVFGENPKGPSQESAMQFRYADEISSQKSGGSSLFGSEIGLDQAGLEPEPPCLQRRVATRRGPKPRRKAPKRSTRGDGNELRKSPANTNTTAQTAVVERSHSSPHTVHPKLVDDLEQSAKASSVTTTHQSGHHRGSRSPGQKERGRYGSASKNNWAPGDASPPPPPPSQHITRRKKIVKADPVYKSMETYYSSLTAAVRQKTSKRSERLERGDVLEGERADPRDRDRISGDTQRRKGRPKILRPTNNFNLMLDELRNSPMLRGITLHSTQRLLK